MPDVVKGIVAHAAGLLAEGDFFPLPCAHPHRHLMSCLYRGGATPTPINRLIGDGVTRHPTQAYESLFHLLMAAVLIVLTREGIWKTHRLQFYLLCYGGYRFATEAIRPEPAFAAGLTFYQWASLALAAGVAAQWAAETAARREGET
ncbi:MAG: prolipoprotein diacylglyceryl transferase family protein [Gemmataceae bacterium]